MNAFYYRVLTHDGRRVAGFVRLAVERDFSARLWLERNRNGIVLSLHRLPSWLAGLFSSNGGFITSGISQNDVAGFLRDLGVMTAAGVPMLEALHAISEEHAYADNPRIAGVARALINDLDSGASISEAFNRHADIFPETVRNLVAIGDEIGAIDRVLMEGSEHMERIARMGRNSRRALIYPAFVFAAIVGAAAFWVFYVIPKLSQLFRQMGVELPRITVWVLNAADWLTAHGKLVLVLAIILVLGPIVAVKVSKPFRHRIYRLAHRLPVARVIVRSSGMAFISEYLALLITAGLDMVRSLGVMERSISDEFYRAKIDRVRKVVERGERLGPAMRASGGFPAMAVRMITVGEETGTLDRQLQHLASEYRQRFDHVMESLGEIIRPLVILLAGALFIIMIIALLLPVYELVKHAVAIPTG
ncbi:MAG TPA: type II secretion system F family protein [Rhodanobacteraceae bacterium]|nr:type II secretion system F family protein [Rhodanobacteraceae bacterium]